MRVNVELLEYHLAIEHLVIDDVVPPEDLEYHFLLLSHRALNAQDGVQLIDVEVYGLLVVKRIEIQVEFKCIYVFFGMFELEIEVFHQHLGIGNYLGVLDLVAQD
jgi:hypothetical protein